MDDKRRSFYQMTYIATNKPIWMEDMGNVLSISGLLLEGMGTHVLVLTPGANDMKDFPHVIRPTVDEWCELLRISDDPVIYERGPNNTIKAIHRKVERAVGGAVQQQVWVRDGFQCMYCFKPMGQPGVVLSIDHWIPIEMGGDEDMSNYLSSCRQCNKLKGNRDPKEFCEKEKLDYEGRVLYLTGKAPASFISDSR
jgi:hypothetical protein